MRNLLFILIIAVFAAGCSGDQTGQSETLRQIAVTENDSIIDRAMIVFDNGVSADGNGSIKINAAESILVRLYEFDDIDIEDAQLWYEAKIRTENFSGVAYLEMWCQFDDLGEFFSRDLSSPVIKADEWKLERTPFYLEKGQNPDRVKLNLVIKGSGTVWVDDIKLVKQPLG